MQEIKLFNIWESRIKVGKLWPGRQIQSTICFPKFYYNIVTIILYILSMVAFIHLIIAELSNCHKDHMDCKYMYISKNTYYFYFYRKSSQNSSLGCTDAVLGTKEYN